jgi:hypothetical protein
MVRPKFCRDFYQIVGSPPVLNASKMQIKYLKLFCFIPGLQHTGPTEWPAWIPAAFTRIWARVPKKGG